MIGYQASTLYSTLYIHMSRYMHGEDTNRKYVNTVNVGQKSGREVALRKLKCLQGMTYLV